MHYKPHRITRNNNEDKYNTVSTHLHTDGGPILGRGGDKGPCNKHYEHI